MPHKKPSGVAQDRRNLENHIVPLIGTLLVSEVEREHIGRVMRDVAGGKTAKDEKTKPQGRRIVRGGEIVANRVKALLSKMFEFAEERKMRPAGSNPCRGVKRYGEHKVERFLSNEELARLGTALVAVERGGLPYFDGAIKHTKSVEPLTDVKNGREGLSKIVPLWKNPIAVAAIHLLLFTGCRVGEILNLQWQHVDLERRLLRLPDSKRVLKSCIFPKPQSRSYQLFPGRSLTPMSLSAHSLVSRSAPFASLGSRSVKLPSWSIFASMICGTASPALVPPAA